MAGRPGSTAALLFVLIAVSAGLQCAAETPCQKVDHDALLAFKKGIISDPEGIVGKWGDVSIDCCHWGFVECNSAGHVVQIDLRPDPAFDDETVYVEGTKLLNTSFLNINYVLLSGCNRSTSIA
jgi:hypothetical protein